MVVTEDKGMQQTIDFVPKQTDLHKGRQVGRNIRGQEIHSLQSSLIKE